MSVDTDTEDCPDCGGEGVIETPTLPLDCPRCTDDDQRTLTDFER